MNLGNCVTMFAGVNTSQVCWEVSRRAALTDVTFVRTRSRRCTPNWTSSLTDGCISGLLQAGVAVNEHSLVSCYCCSKKSQSICQIGAHLDFPPSGGNYRQKFL